ncbi:hypothetical protein EX30DRAFT_343852 [Ascodesmis nigricans]|uniref:Myb-like transcription factor n=1 Tax=Ascodesmis nigricans TaxID=341454 RepID=A0A4V3SHW2_9PEZI|nr:hypothetical protein EX30DRAFT_343852 [Ascodesmis nigricans]
MASIASLLCPMPPPQKEQRREDPPAHSNHSHPEHPSRHYAHSHPFTQPPSPPNLKRSLSTTSLAGPTPAKKQSKWTAEEDALIIALRGRGEKWDDISRQLPGRSAISCRLHYQNYLERRSEWDEEKKNRLARLYERFKQEMWTVIGNEMGTPWRAVEAMHWQLGEQEMARRAGVIPFSLNSVVLDSSQSKKRSLTIGGHGQLPSPSSTSPHGHGPPFSAPGGY